MKNKGQATGVEVAVEPPLGWAGDAVTAQHYAVLGLRGHVSSLGTNSLPRAHTGLRDDARQLHAAARSGPAAAGLGGGAASAADAVGLMTRGEYLYRVSVGEGLDRWLLGERAHDEESSTLWWIDASRDGTVTTRRNPHRTLAYHGQF